MRHALRVGQRVVIRRRGPEWDRDYPDEYGVIEPIEGGATKMSRRRGTRGLRCLVRLDDGSLCESFAANVFPSEEKKDCPMCAANTGTHPGGQVIRVERCGCEVAGLGLLPNPWHVHYCQAHAAAPDLLFAAQQGLERLEAWAARHDGMYGEDFRAVENLRAAIAKAEESHG